MARFDALAYGLLVAEEFTRHERQNANRHRPQRRICRDIWAYAILFERGEYHQRKAILERTRLRLPNWTEFVNALVICKQFAELKIGKEANCDCGFLD